MEAIIEEKKIIDYEIGEYFTALGERYIVIDKRGHHINEMEVTFRKVTERDIRLDPKANGVKS